ncbi:hypothetical protein D9V32_08650 [Mycetocola tolaasinivorans]|uniref:LPXTG cell wall anchor domain-containing protein n=1 Tax=Mycetocola tolaasinivorans TaxID=76635 RepID=A0A3L7A6R7_9MICO|nr:hypothetical protein [Mycetocola tolaasinivorans]RLP75540.1 hypothetical protein D9V32_08650 [Mycetocola tolaasinivorans]
MSISIPKSRPRFAQHPGVRAGILTGVLALTGVLGFAGPAIAAPAVPTVTLTAPESVTAGDPVPVTIHLTGVSDTFALQAGLAADPALLTADEHGVNGPTGGFTSARVTATGEDIVHTRLGSSPALNGDITLTARLTAAGSGTATIALSSLTLVDGSGAGTSVTALPSTTVRVLAVDPGTSPSPSPTPSGGTGGTPTPTPSTSTPTDVPSGTTTPTPTPGGPDGTATPTPGSSETPGGTATPSPTDTPTSSATPGDPGTGEPGGLPSTGVAIGASLLVALAAAGIGLVLMRARKATR